MWSVYTYIIGTTKINFIINTYYRHVLLSTPRCTGIHSPQKGYGVQDPKYSSLLKQTEVFHLKTVTIHHCVGEILRLGTGHKAIVIFTDNRAVIKALDGRAGRVKSPLIWDCTYALNEPIAKWTADKALEWWKNS